MAIASFCAHCGAENQPGAALCHACQHPLDPHAAFQVNGGLLHARYQLLSQIGSGGFGAVYKARDTQQNGRLVAVKQIHLAGLSSQEIIEATDAFNREAQILSALNHPLLPQIFDRFSDPQHWYLVMTLIQGQTLDEYLQQQQLKALPARAGLSLEETLSIALRLCDALSYLHGQQPPVIFRDLKPGNIMRTRNGQLYLIDFGIARRFKPGQAKDTMPFGSPGFAAPEQYGRAQTTPQADLYSLGALLYCLLSGDDPSEHPFQFPSLRPCNTASLRGVNALIQRLVALDPAQRPADIQEVQRELERIQDLYKQEHQQVHIWTPPQGQTPPSFPAVGSKQQQTLLNQLPKQSTKRKTTRRTLLVAGLVIGGLVATGEAIKALTGPPQPAPLSTINQSVGNLDDATATAQSAQATATAANQIPAVPANGPTFWSPDLSHAAVANLRKNQIEIYKVLNPSFVQNVHLQTMKFPTSFAVVTVQWSADNNNIAVQADNGMLYAWNAKTGQQLFTFSDAALSSSKVIISWSPDGQYCTFGYQDSYSRPHLTIVQASNGETYAQMDFPGYNSDSATALAWSPDSRYLAFPDASTWEYGSVWKVDVWDRKTKQISRSFSGTVSSYTGGNFILTITWSPKGGKLATIIDYEIWLNQFASNQQAQSLAYIDSRAFTDGNGLTYGPAWSPDEQYLAMLSDQSVLAIYNTSDGVARYLSVDGWQNYTYDTLPKIPNYLEAFAWSADGKSITVADNGNILTNWPLR
ncbi:MAG TPA: WD40 repeat domain-containing serine/threonine protein kinase [Ktedonobacteraceae bacterium]|nr:WD40 repeat domain-containing serine/threonine protein kinase [Ktedonobacteraceae bacterium]